MGFTVAELRDLCHHFIGIPIREVGTRNVVGIGRRTRIEGRQLIVMVECSRKYRRWTGEKFVELVVMEAKD